MEGEAGEKFFGTIYGPVREAFAKERETQQNGV
jgi:hypothetical protein